MGELKYNKRISWILLFILLDQGIKLVIAKLALNQVTVIIDKVLYFSPIQNKGYSYLNQLFALGIHRSTHIIINIIAVFILILLFKGISEKKFHNLTLQISKVFVFAGALCSLLDKTIWDGSLDYIRLNGLFTFDLKDIYIQLGIITLLYNWKRIRQVHLSDLFKS